MKRRLLGITLVSLATVLAGSIIACGQSELPGDAVAKVGETYITAEELEQEVAREAAAYGITKEAYPDSYRGIYESLEKDVLQNLVLNEIASQEAAKLGFSVTEEEVQAELDTYLTYYSGDQAAFEQDLQSAGYDLETFKENLRGGLLRDKVRAEAIKDVTEVSEDEVVAYYEANKSDYYVEPSRGLRHILIKPKAGGTASGGDSAGTVTDSDWADALALAKQVRGRLVTTGDWDGLAAEYSGDFATKDRGGDLGTVTEGQTVKEFEDAAFALELDEISQPVKTVYGYEIIQATAVTIGGIRTLEEVRDQIESQLLAQAQDEAWRQWLQQKVDEADVIYRSDLRPETTTTTSEATTTTLGDPADTGAPAETTTTE